MDWKLEIPPNFSEEMTTYDMKVVRARRSGYAYPYEIIKMLTGGQDVTDIQDATSYTSDGTFQEYDIDEQGELQPINRNMEKTRAVLLLNCFEQNEKISRRYL